MPKGPAPAREAALDALYGFCAGSQSALENSNRHILTSKPVSRKDAPGTLKAELLLRGSISSRGLDGRDAGLATEIFYGTLRNLTAIDHALGAFVRAPKGGLELGVLCVLRTAAYQLLYLERTPSYAVVSDAAEQAKLRHGRPASGFVNGVLRSLLRGREGLAAPADARITYSFPDWLADRWTGRYGPDGAARLMKAMNETPALTLRVNLTRTSREVFMERLAADGIGATPGKYAPEAVRINAGGGEVSSLPGYDEGLFSVQDEAAMLVARLLAPAPGGTYLDACAAPGGKTTHIAELSGGRASVAAADIGLDKLGVIKENVRRLGTGRIFIVGADSLALPFGIAFDGALLDAPCTGLGVIRRRPDIRYLRVPADIKRHAELQIQLMRSVAETLKPGGALVYATCSTEPEEGEGVVEAFLSDRADFLAEDAAEYLPECARGLVSPEGFMRTRPDLHDVDGFFAARLVKESA